MSDVSFISWQKSPILHVTMTESDRISLGEVCSGSEDPDFKRAEAGCSVFPRVPVMTALNVSARRVESLYEGDAARCF